MKNVVDVDACEQIGYTGDMPRSRKDEKRDSTLTIKVPESLYKEVRWLVETLDRTESYIGYRLIERGMAAYMRDGKLMEDGPPGAIERIAIRDALVDEKSEKKRKRGEK
jgi:hypothetical protein